MSESFQLDVEQVDGVAYVRPIGDIDLDTTRELYETVRKLASKVDKAVVEFDGVGFLHSSGIAALSILGEEYADRNKVLNVVNLRPEHADVMRMMPAHLGRQEVAEPEGFWVSLGSKSFQLFDEMLKLNELAFDTISTGFLALIGKRSMPKGAVAEQAVLMGVDALPIVLLLSFLLGLILAFQSAYQLQEFGASIYVANLVGVSMTREFGPLVAGIVLSGRTGSAIAAELGTMTVQEEVDALRTMGLDPMSFLVLPRVIALLIVQPMLTLMGDIVGILGGLLIGMLLLDLSPAAYYEQTVMAVQLGDFLNGLVKSLIFASIISFTGCYTGLNIQGGASGVGMATTRAVVASIFLIIFADSVFTVATTLDKLL